MTTKNVEIINGCIKIDDSKYTDNPNLTVVMICEGVRSIGKLSFANCKNLKTVYLPESIKHIARDSFKNSGISMDISNESKQPRQVIMFYCKKNSYADNWAQKEGKYIVVNN